MKTFLAIIGALIFSFVFLSIEAWVAVATGMAPTFWKAFGLVFIFSR